MFPSMWPSEFLVGGMKVLFGLKFKAVNEVVLDWEGYRGACLRGRGGGILGGEGGVLDGECVVGGGGMYSVFML